MREIWKTINYNWNNNIKGFIKNRILCIEIIENTKILLHYNTEILRETENQIIINKSNISLSLTDKNYIRSALGIDKEKWKEMQISNHKKYIINK